MIYNPRLFNPIYWHIKPLLRDPNIRYIMIEGGSSSAKTAEICDALLLDQMEFGYSTMVFRRYHVNIKDSVYNSFKLASNRLSLTNNIYTFQEDLIKCTQKDCRVRFRGLDDEENVKGIEDYDVVFNNEWSQMLKKQFDQQRKRLRGRPNQKFICDWNPISAKLWQYDEWIDKDEWTDLPLNVPGAPTKFSSLNKEFSFKRINKAKNAIWMKVTYRDNYWVVGHPSGQGGFKDVHTIADFEHDKIHNPNLYRVYANGERGIMRTGGEFFKQFDETRHVSALRIEPTTLHISLDENVMPYCTVSCWQVIGKKINQVHEIPCKAPDNNATKAAHKLVKWLGQIKYKDVVFIYGDPSSSARSTIDINNSSFYDKFIAVLRDAGYQVVNRVAKSAPEVALSASFINDIYEHELGGWSITISDTCKISIDDYIIVKEDKDGKMLKPKTTDEKGAAPYEAHGHFSDAKRYFITTILKSEFISYKQKGRRVGTTAA